MTDTALEVLASDGSERQPAKHRRAPGASRASFRALLATAMFASGAAALVYQLVWFQLLSLVIGASAPSLGVLLAAFMGGMGLGAWLLPRVAAGRGPLRVYVIIEVGIALLAIGILNAMPLLGASYFAAVPAGAGGFLLRAAITGVCLLPPAMLIGATLPALAPAAGGGGHGAARIGYLYCANVVGAVAGCVLAGFYFLRVHDIAVATYVAAALNIAAACAALVAAHLVGRAIAIERAAAGTRTPRAAIVCAVTALSGFTALTAEVLWTRHLALLLGGTVYTFALILAVFLGGLGIGSAAGAALARPRIAGAVLAVCQALLCAALAWGAYAALRSLPYWPLDVTLPAAAGVALQLDLLRVAYVVLPAALLWGASFPLAIAAAAPPGESAARSVAAVYAANTFGAIVGALATTFVLVTAVGSRATLQLAVLASCIAAVLASFVLSRARAPRRVAAAAGAVALGLVTAAAMPQLPGELVAFGRFMPTRAAGAEILHVAEGLTAPIAVSRQIDGALTYHNAGKAQASTYVQDMRLQRTLGHLATLTADDPRSAFVIGLGAGITAGAVAIDPAVERVVVAEIEPAVPDAAGEHFAAYNYGVTDDPKVTIAIDDGRHFLATSAATYDVITSDPLDPWVRGAAALYTREFWELAKARLNPGGSVTVFLQLYESTEEAVKSEVATFLEAFPNGALFANTVEGAGYDAVLLGRAGDAPIDIDRVAARLRSTAYASVAESLREVGIVSAADLLGTYVAQRADLEHWLAAGPINTDRNLRLQYLAGDGVNRYEADAIFARLAPRESRFPQRLFVGERAALELIAQRVRARRGDY